MSATPPAPVLILGAGGLLATDLLRYAPSPADAVAVPRTTCDLTESDQIAAALRRWRPRAIINAAAYTAVDQAESDPARAFAVNATGVGHLAAACAAHGIPLVHFSTDYVFPGTGRVPLTETDPIAPVNTYGASKRAGELLLEASTGPWLCLRTQWLFGVAGKSFPRTMWQRAQAGLATRVVADQWGNPTSTADLAEATWRLLAQGATGYVHVANRGAATWHMLADRVFTRAGVPALLTPCTTAEYPTPAPRPAYSVLATERLAAHGMTLPPWEAAIDTFLAHLDAEPGSRPA